MFIAILYTTAPAVGAMARYNLLTTVQTGEVGSVDGNLKYAERPEWFNTWQATGLAAASLFPAILLGIFDKRANKEGAIAGMLTGLVFTYAYIEFFKGLFLKWAGAPWGENTVEHWFLGISPEGIGVVGMLLNFTVAFVVSRLTKAPGADIQAMVENIRVPRAE